MRSVSILGSTGSIGTQAIEVCLAAPQRFSVVALAAGGSNLELLAQQAIAVRPQLVASAREGTASEIKALIASLCAAQGIVGYQPSVEDGAQGILAAAAIECDVVLNGITGSIGLEPTLTALEHGRTLALANKESLIIGGRLVTDAARPGQIVPVDSEHCALAQCLEGRTNASLSDVRRLVITASGGPFRGYTREQLENVDVAAALNHPTWAMGPVITTNSATLVNKGLEVIEAHLLFDLPFDQIDVVVHPQSMIHSMVEFCDGTTIAQVSPPSMKLPIAWALGYPERVADAAPGCNWLEASTWTFEPVAHDVFEAITLAKKYGAAGGVQPALFNAANEVGVQAFFDGKSTFLGILDIIKTVCEDAERPTASSLTVDTVLAADAWARAAASRAIELSAKSGV